VRRLGAITLSLALVASILGMTTSATAIPPGDTPDTGNLYVSPTSFSVGQSVKLTANFPSGLFTVTYFKKVSDTEWTSIGTDASNRYGNAYLNHEVNESEEIYARITSGGAEGRTETQTLTPTPAPVVAPDGPDVASLYQSPTTYAAGDEIKITANFPSGTFPVTLYKEGPADTWTEVATKTSNKYGNAYFYDFSVTAASQRVFARKANNDRTEVDEIKPSPKLTLSIRRDCTGNDCDPTATAYGELDPAQADRQLTLQRLSGSSWLSVSGAVAGTTGADGTVEIQFPLDGVPQWTTRSYRLQGEADASNPAVTSNTIQFMPGPTELGRNVMRIDVEKGVYPTTKGPEYKGEATLSRDGEVFLDDVGVDKIGVRGSSTAKLTKKPYKLKFTKSPKDTGVFGMDADKSWTLLAGFVDQTFVREKVQLDLGRRMSNLPWTPDSRYVELFVNDQYRGSYLMAESVKIDGDRVDVDKESGMILETDAPKVTNTKIEFLSSKGKIPILFKDPDEVKPTGDPDYQEGVTPAKLKAAKNRVNAFESKLYSSSTREQYPDFIDVDSAIDFMLVREFVKDNDSDFSRSNYFSWDQEIDTKPPLNPLRDGRFHFGPVWDADRSAGNVDSSTAGYRYVRSPAGWMMRGTGTPSNSGRVFYRTHWFVQLFKSASFNAAVDARWLAVRDEFSKVGDAEVAALKAEIGPGAANDRARWANEPKRFPSNGSFDQEIAYVTQWYKDRFDWMDDNM